MFPGAPRLQALTAPDQIAWHHSPEMPEPPSVRFQEDGFIDADFELNDADEMEVVNGVCIRSETGHPDVERTGAKDEGQLDDEVQCTDTTLHSTLLIYAPPAHNIKIK